MKNLFVKFNQVSLVKRIVLGIILGLILAFSCPNATWISTLDSLFVGAL